MSLIDEAKVAYGQFTTAAIRNAHAARAADRSSRSEALRDRLATVFGLGTIEFAHQFELRWIEEETNLVKQLRLDLPAPVYTIDGLEFTFGHEYPHLALILPQKSRGWDYVLVRSKAELGEAIKARLTVEEPDKP